MEMIDYGVIAFDLVALVVIVLGVGVKIVMLLFPAFPVSFALRWYWARFNGSGFVAGDSAVARRDLARIPHPGRAFRLVATRMAQSVSR